MASILYYPLLAFGLYILYLIYLYARNIGIAAKTGFPTVHVPLWQQNHIVWVILGPVSRTWLKKKLPTTLFNRIALTIYGLEFFQKTQPYDDYVYPQIRKNPNLRGHGKSYMLVTSGKLELWTWDAEIAKVIVARPNDFVQFDAASLVMNVFGENVLTTDGSNWARHRRIVAGAVTERVSSVVWNESVRQTRDLLATINDGSRNVDGSESATTDRMFDLVKRVAIHVLYAAGMGNSQDFAADLANGGEKPQAGYKLTYIDAVKAVNENTAGPTILPTPVLLNWPSWLPGQAAMKELGQAKVEFPQHTRDALAREKELEAQSGSVRNNVMSALISASERNEGDDARKGNVRKGPALTDEELVGNLYIFTAAGFDTTANTISYALTFLAMYPKWQEWLIEELDNILPADISSDFEYTSIFPKAHRTLAVMLETLRLLPPIIHIAKMTKAPQTITTQRSGTFTIPGNSTTYVNNILIHRDPETWRNLNMTALERAAANDTEDDVPGDETHFRPSRWINIDPSASTPLYQPAKGTYLPWSSGPRVCPGQKMAQVEFVAIIATLFGSNRLEPVRKNVPVRGAPDVLIPESDDALKKRLNALIDSSAPKLTLEMDVYNIKDGEDRGFGMRWVKRK